jgi:hypothetical protein
MVFIETEIFTRRIQEILTDEEYSLLQADLIKRPEAGVLIPGGKGLRKLRWGASGKGKRGGMRLIYYYFVREDQIYMIYPFRKSDQEDLTPEQLKTLAEYVKGGVV